MESFYTNFSDTNKWTQSTDISGTTISDWGTKDHDDLLPNPTDPINLTTLTSVTLDEAKFLDQFMTFSASEGQSKIEQTVPDKTIYTPNRTIQMKNNNPNIRSRIKSSTPNSNPCVTTSSISKSLPPSSSLNPVLHDGKLPGKRRINSAFESNTYSGTTESFKVRKPNIYEIPKLSQDDLSDYYGVSKVTGGINNINVEEDQGGHNTQCNSELVKNVNDCEGYRGDIMGKVSMHKNNDGGEHRNIRDHVGIHSDKDLNEFKGDIKNNVSNISNNYHGGYSRNINGGVGQLNPNDSVGHRDSRGGVSMLAGNYGGEYRGDIKGGVSILRQQLQARNNSNTNSRTEETICKDCNKMFTTKCLLKVCRKSDEVICRRCGQELTAKCLLQVCPDIKL